MRSAECRVLNEVNDEHDVQWEGGRTGANAMSGWIALVGSLGAAVFAWRASPSAGSDSEVSRRRARWLAAGCALFAASVWIDALGALPGLCAFCVSIGASCSAMPFAVGAARRVRKRIEGGRACRTAS